MVFSRGMERVLSEAFSRILKTHGICTAVRPHTTLRNLLMRPKEKISNEEKPEVVYKIIIIIIIIIIIDTFIKRHKCLGYRGAGGDVNQADCRNRKVFSWRLKPCLESHSVMFAGRVFQVTGAA